MSSILPFLTFAGLVSLAVGSPLAQPEKRSHSFKVDQVTSAKKTLRSGPIQVQKTLNKFGVTVPESINAAAAAAAQQGSVSATPEQYDSEYLCPVTVGSTTLNLDFDTGSADLWVYSSELPASERAGHSYYTVSSSKVLSGDRWSIQYADGSGAAGNVYADTVVIGMALISCPSSETKLTRSP